MFFFFVLHHLLRLLFPTARDVRLNCLNLMIGGFCYIMGYSILLFNSNSNTLKMLKLAWWYLCVIDVIAMGIVYKDYYGRSIVHEVGDDLAGGNWDYDESRHQYKKSNLKKKEEFFQNKMDKLEKLDTTVEKADELINELDDKQEDIIETIDTINKNAEQLDENMRTLHEEFVYRPGGEVFAEAKTDFETIAEANGSES